MTCLRCKDGFITSALLGRVACLSCRDARIDASEISVPTRSAEKPTRVVVHSANPLGRLHFDRVFIAQQGFAVWQTKGEGEFSFHLMPPEHDHISRLFNADGVPDEYRRWRWGSDKIGGWSVNIDVSHEFGHGSTASIDQNWWVSLLLTPTSQSQFSLVSDDAIARRFRVAIKLPEPEKYV